MLKHLPNHDFKHFGIYAWYSLIFLQPFNQFGALRTLCMTVLLICIVGALHGARNVPNKPLAPRIALVVALWAVAISLLGPYPVDSFHALRKDLLVQALMLIAALTYVRTATDVWRVVGAALAGFAGVTFFSLVEIGSYWAHNGLSLWVDRGHDFFWGGYATTGSFYIPLLAGWLIAAPKRPIWTIVGWTALTAAVLLVILYGSRTPLVVIAVALLTLLILLKRWRSLMIAGLLALCLIGLIQLAPTSHLDKYKTLLKGETYVTNSGLSQRLSVWEGAWQVISERPLTGYGYGWKKLALAINDGDFAERWQKSPDIAAYYLVDGKARYGKVNPHNYALQVMFEIGMIGLAMTLIFWLVAVHESIVLLRGSDKEIKKLAACLIAVLAAYAAANLTNGHWVGGLANLSLAFAGCLLALARIAIADAPQAQG
jgi:O-antigen ligase